MRFNFSIMTVAIIMMITSVKSFITQVKPMSTFRNVGSIHKITKQLCDAPITPSTSSIVDEVTDLSRLEIRVGKILEIRKHPEAENLYVEKVDCGTFYKLL